VLKGLISVTISNLGRASTKFVASTLMVGVLGEGVAEVGAYKN